MLCKINTLTILLGKIPRNISHNNSDIEMNELKTIKNIKFCNLFVFHNIEIF